MAIWAYLADNFLDFQLTKSEMMRRGEKEGQKMRCNAHFFSHFSLKLGETDINWEKLVKEAKTAKKRCSGVEQDFFLEFQRTKNHLDLWKKRKNSGTWRI